MHTRYPQVTASRKTEQSLNKNPLLKYQTSTDEIDSQFWVY